MSTVSINQPIFPPGTLVSLYEPTDVEATRLAKANPRNASKVAAISAGASAVAATGTVNPAGNNNSIVYTAVAAGAAGNAITIAYVNNGASQSLDVDVDGTAITVSLATDGSSVVTSTADDVKAAIAAYAPAAALVTSADAAANDGSGLVTAMAVAPLSGGSDAVGTNQALVDSKGTLPLTAAAGRYTAAGQVAGEWRFLNVDID